MHLAKPCIDIGIYTNQREEQLHFWQNQVGLPFEELLKLGGGSQQHRHQLNGSVFKLNHSRNPIVAAPPAGYQELLIVRPDQTVVEQLVDPDGNRVSLVPAGHLGISHIGIRMEVSSIEKFQHFYRDVLQIEQVSDTTFRWGTTLLLLVENPQRSPTEGMQGLGYRYITVQVWQVDAEHEAFLARGGSEARPPTTLGSTARISFITDPDQNWIEVSQRASLTGSLE
jgi:catechol 2,3-dioxygenase-like lactoylglutathione lyase family enzyme